MHYVTSKITLQRYEYNNKQYVSIERLSKEVVCHPQQKASTHLL